MRTCGESLKSGRGWVVEVDGSVEAFAIGNAQSGNIWALFVVPEAQGRGYGSQLHDVMVGWLREQHVALPWLTNGQARYELSQGDEANGARVPGRRAEMAAALRVMRHESQTVRPPEVIDLRR